MTREDLQQISNLLDEKLDQKFKENNQILEERLDKKFDEKIGSLDKKIDNIDKKFDEKIDSLAMMTQNGFDELEKKLKLHTEERLTPINSSLSYLIKKVELMEQELFRLKQNLDKVEKRLERLIKSEDENVMAQHKEIVVLRRDHNRLNQDMAMVKIKLNIRQEAGYNPLANSFF